LLKSSIFSCVGSGFLTELIKYLPKLLKEDFGIELENGLKRDYVEVSPKRYEEINIIR